MSESLDEENETENEIDPRVEQLISLVNELAEERVQAGLECLKTGDDRAELFFLDGINALKHLKKLLVSLGVEDYGNKRIPIHGQK